ncbi:Gfo/Idh/MocA family protein [Nocardia rhamnosiphila]
MPPAGLGRNRPRPGWRCGPGCPPGALSVRWVFGQGGVPRLALAFGNPGDLIHRDDIDLVVVAVKVPHHRALVEAAVCAGKNVLCEWPLGNLAEAEGLADLAARAGVRVFVGLQARANPVLRYLRDLVAEGYLGEVLSASVLAAGEVWGATIRSGMITCSTGTTAPRC